MLVPNRELMPLVRAALARGQRVRMTVKGSSMRPFIHDGDVVELVPIEAHLTIGDIVLARCAEQRYVVHRTVRVDGDAVWLRGDGQPRGEGPLPRQNVHGKVVAVSHMGTTRVLDRGPWHAAGRTWVALHPLGLRLLQLSGLLRRIARRARRTLRRSLSGRGSADRARSD